MSPESCNALVARAEASGFRTARLQDRGRRNQETFIDCPATLQVILDALCRRVASTPKVDFHIVGMGPILEFYKYCNGASIGPHADAAVQVTAGLTSSLTFVLYLNDGFKGGETFFPDNGLRSRPKAGDGLLFQHDLIHEASQIDAGTKYILRTSVAVTSTIPPGARAYDANAGV